MQMNCSLPLSLRIELEDRLTVKRAGFCRIEEVGGAGAVETDGEIVGDGDTGLAAQGLADEGPRSLLIAFGEQKFRHDAEDRGIGGNSEARETVAGCAAGG